MREPKTNTSQDGQRPSIAPQSAEIFNIRLSRVSLEDVKRIFADRIERRIPGFVVTPNVDHVCLCYHNPRFREAYSRAFLHFTDGTPVLWAARLFGEEIPEKLSGSDMLPVLSEWAAMQGYSIFLLGGTPGTADKSAEVLRERFPGLRIAGVNCPPYGFEDDPRKIQEVIDHLRAARPDICFVGLGAPKQELFMNHYRDAAGVPVMMGVGGSFDFVAGRTRRAPGWIQDLGVEWLWRLSMDPRRLWRRYLVDDMVFFKLLYLEFNRRLRRFLPAAKRTPH